MSDWRLGLLARVALGMLREDPSLLATQVSRRYLSAGARGRLGTLAGRLPGRGPLGGPRAMLAQLADRPDLINRGKTLARVDARALWESGRASEAIESLPQADPLRARLADEWGLICRERCLTLSTARPANEGIDVLHLLTNSLPYTQSGYTVRSHRLLTALHGRGLRVAAATRIGYPVTIGSFRVPEVSSIDGIDYHRLLPHSMERLPSRRIEQQSRMLLRLAERLNPKVLHTTTDYRNGYVAEAVARALGVPWVYEMRGQLEKSWLARQPEGARVAAEASPRYRAWQDTETRMAMRADAVVVLSEVQKGDLIQRGVEASKIWVGPNAFDWPEDTPHLSRSAARERVGLPEAQIWVGSVSAVVDYEGFDTLLRAVKLLVDRGIDARVVIVGEGVSRPSLVALAESLGISDRAVFPGRVPLEESHYWYQALDLFTVPRRDTPVCRTITPLKPLEALACGTPVLVSDLPPLLESIQGGAGVAIHPESAGEWADAVAGLLPGSEAYRAASAAALSLSRTRSWQSNAETYGRIYAEIRG